jgi:hypothetical protein
MHIFFPSVLTSSAGKLDVDYRPAYSAMMMVMLIARVELPASLPECIRKSSEVVLGRALAM